MQPSAKIICDSESPNGVRLTTMEVVMHRFVLAEMNTHRMFSRNSASSRAIPVRKQIQRIKDDLAFPVIWPSEQKGMQGGDVIDKPMAAQEVWRSAARTAVEHAEDLIALGVHKSVINRLLEPFMSHTVIVSSTDWDNFWRQRCSPLAQPEIRVAAEAMRAAYEGSQEERVELGDWHLPYVQPEERGAFGVRDLCKLSAARCARVSYLTHDGHPDIDADLRLYDRLTSAEPPHASPLEHVATPGGGRRGNFTGWDQLRHTVLGF